MVNLGKKTHLSPEKVVLKATEFFGPRGLGLTRDGAVDGLARFEGSGGFVNIEATSAAHGSDVTVQSQEWEYQARQFIDKL